VLEFRAALNAAIAEAMAGDERVVLLGEAVAVAVAGGVFKVTEGLVDRFGNQRVIDTPISELALVGAASGASITGLRPIVEVMFGDFIPHIMDGLINQAAKYRFLSGGRHSAPLMVRTAVGAGGRFGAINSQNPGVWQHGVSRIEGHLSLQSGRRQSPSPGVHQRRRPMVFLEHKRFYSVKGPADEQSPPLGAGRVVRNGADLTIVSIMKGVRDALAAADALAVRGIDAEVLDLRSLRPLDLTTVLESVAKTHRLVAVEEGSRTGGWAAGLLGAVAEEELDALDDVWTITPPDSPIPFSPTLEDAYLRGATRIEASVLEHRQVAA